jgi:hypothetical protein
MNLAVLLSALVAFSLLLVVARRAAKLEQAIGAHALATLGFHFMLVDAVREMTRASLLDARRPTVAVCADAWSDRGPEWAIEPDVRRWS